MGKSKFYLTLLLTVLTCVIGTNRSSWEDLVRLRRQTAGPCVFPPYPENGEYSVGGKPSAKPGEEADAVQLHVSCHPGYTVLGNQILYCVTGAWSDAMPTCVRFCKLDPHPSVKYYCQATTDDSDENYYRDCQAREPTGTIVRPLCNQPNYYYSGVLSHMRCVEGRWDYIAICQPECGTITPEAKPLIIGGQESKRGEFPWHAGLYRKDITPFKLICGGSLVSNTVIISAAHCVWDKNESKLRPAALFAVALGKLLREWNNPLDKDAQQFDVMSVRVPARFQGLSSNYQDDIAVIWLSAPAVYRPYIRPVCLDFDPIFESHQLRDGNLGKVAGWGIEDLEGTPSPVLKVLELPYVRIESCIEDSPPTFRPFITSDKICAGYTNGSSVCQGDSGGGLVFQAKDRIAERYYLRGIVSTAPETDAACNAYSRTSFTQITKHRTFIEKNTVSFAQSTSIIQQNNEILCILPPYPDNGNYTVLGSQGVRPGQELYSAHLIVSCDSGYVADTETNPSCTYGRWTHDIPKCISVRIDRCKRSSDWDATHKCSDDFDSPTRRCKEFEGNATIVTRKCSKNEEKFQNLFDKPVAWDAVAQCVNGKWEGDLSCVGDKNCGLVTLPGGSELPWVAAIYRKGNTEVQYICGGTLVSNIYVITAAHCVSDLRTHTAANPSNFQVAAGKLYPILDDTRDRNAVSSEVSEIVLSRLFDAKTFTSDIALVVLSSRLKLSTFVQPACMDFTLDVDTLNDVIAKTSSWRLFSAATQGISYKKALLRSVAVRVINRKRCSEELDPKYRKYLTQASICARDIVGQGVCRGDSGLGLVYPVNGRYVLLGAISITLSDVHCSADEPIGYSSLYSTQK